MSGAIPESLALRVVEIAREWKPEGMAPEAWVASLTPEDVADILAEAAERENRMLRSMARGTDPWARAAKDEVIRRAYDACRETAAGVAQ